MSGKVNRGVCNQDVTDDLSCFDPKGVKYVDSDGTVLYERDRQGFAIVPDKRDDDNDK